MSQEITIRAQPLDAERCRFILDHPLLPGRALHFADRRRAAGSPLIEALFAIDNVVSVTVAEDTVTVVKGDAADWRPTARSVGAAIRAQLTTGEPPIAAAALETIASDADIREQVQRLLDEQINPAVAAHGGWIELLDVRGNSVYLQLGGGCQGCGMANVTLRQGIETLLREEIPTLGEIFDQTDHASGRNPYYAPAKK